MKLKRPLMRLLGLRVWDMVSITRKLKLLGYSKLLGLQNPVSIHSHVMITAHHEAAGGDKIDIGRNCVFNDNVNIDITGVVHIGDRVLLAEDVIVYTHSHKIPNLPKEHTAQSNLTIGDDVFIGARAIILSSCHFIGKNARIGAGAVVTKDIPENAIAVGVPAKVVKYLDYK